jgi:hypothetical protein
MLKVLQSDFLQVTKLDEANSLDWVYTLLPNWLPEKPANEPSRKTWLPDCLLCSVGRPSGR